MTMLDYIRETHVVIPENIKRRHALTGRFVDLFLESGEKEITIVASGSSYTAAMCALPFMEKVTGCRVTVMAPFTFTHYNELPRTNGFTVFASQSGSSTNIIAAMDALRARGWQVVVLTASSDGDAKDHADVLIEYGVGGETVGWVTKGVLTLDLFFKLCALDIAEKTGKLAAQEVQYWLSQIERASECYPEVERASYRFIERHIKLLTSMSHEYIIGSGPGYGPALEAAVKNGETIQIPAFAYETEEFLHGPNYQLSPNHTVMIVDCDPKTHQRNVEIAAACYDVTDRVFVISSLEATSHEPGFENHFLCLDAKVSPYVSAPAILPFFQIISYELTTRMNRWERHPLFANFRQKCGSKTEGYLNRKRN